MPNYLIILPQKVCTVTINNVILFSFLNVDMEHGMPTLTGEFISQKMHVQISCETITSIIDIARRLSETITEKTAIANSVFETRNPPTTNSENSNINIAKNITNVEKRIVVGHIKLKGFDLKLWFFGYSIRDPAWASLSLESYQKEE